MEAKTIKKELEIVILDDDIDVGGGSGYGYGNGGGGGGGDDIDGGGEGCLVDKKKAISEAMKVEVDNGEVGRSGVGGGGCGSKDDNGGCLSRPSPTPFLRKTFDLVENPETDFLISWSADRKSFIVWDSVKFASDVLPRHFRHNNFSSFICQLNLYGFRKIHSDQWEFANEWFQGGKRHLLNNIKRRRPSKRSSCVDRAKLGFEAQLEKLRNDQKKMKIEFLKLKRQQENIQNELADVEKCLQSTKCKKQKLAMFLDKTFNPTNLHQFILQLRQKRELADGEMSKKRRLVAPSSNESGVEVVDTTNQNVNCSSQNQDKLKALHSDIQTPFSTSLEDDQSGSSNHDKKDNEVFGTSTLDFNSEDFIPWEKLLEEDLIFENEGDEELAQHHSKIVLELEDLIAQQAELGGHVNELVEQAGRL